MPVPAPGAVAFKVEMSFTLGGTVESYDEAAQESIKAVLAADAGVSTSAVRLTLTAGSVLVAVEIFVASQAAADQASTTLVTGVVSDSASLQTALQQQFEADGLNTSVVVEEITSAPTTTTEGGPPPIIPIAFGAAGVVVVLLLITVIYLRCKLKALKAKMNKNEKGTGTALSGGTALSA